MHSILESINAFKIDREFVVLIHQNAIKSHIVDQTNKLKTKNIRNILLSYAFDYYCSIVQDEFPILNLTCAHIHMQRIFKEGRRISCYSCESTILMVTIKTEFLLTYTNFLSIKKEERDACIVSFIHSQQMALRISTLLQNGYSSTCSSI